jgi:hypothetical protein
VRRQLGGRSRRSTPPHASTHRPQWVLPSQERWDTSCPPKRGHRSLRIAHAASTNHRLSCTHLQRPRAAPKRAPARSGQDPPPKAALERQRACPAGPHRKRRPLEPRQAQEGAAPHHGRHPPRPGKAEAGSGAEVLLLLLFPGTTTTDRRAERTARCCRAGGRRPAPR